jgi:hypothetical protein
MNWANVNWTAVEALATCATAIIAAGGIFFVLQQLKQVERTIRGDAHERLTTGSIEILKLLAGNPESYAYFYEGKPLTHDDPNRVFVLYVAEIFANYMENVINQKENMGKRDGAVWNRFVVDTCKMAPVVRTFLIERKEWYSPELVGIAEGVPTSDKS